LELHLDLNANQLNTGFNVIV